MWVWVCAYVYMWVSTCTSLNELRFSLCMWMRNVLLACPDTYMLKSVCVSACVHVGSVHVCVHLCCVQNTMHHALASFILQTWKVHLSTSIYHIHTIHITLPFLPTSYRLTYHDVAASLPECGCDTVNPWLLSRWLVAYQTLSTQVQLLKSEQN